MTIEVYKIQPGVLVGPGDDAAGVSKIFPAVVVGLRDEVATSKLQPALIPGPRDEVASSKINASLVIGPPEIVAVAKAQPGVLVGPGLGNVGVSQLNPELLLGPGLGNVGVSKLDAYLILHGLVTSTDEIFDPPPPTIESQATFGTNPLDAGVTDLWDDTASSGLNAVGGVYALVWKVLYEDQVAYIEGFLARHAGNEPFKYTIPTESTEKIFKCRSWETSRHGGTFSMRAEFRQVFDLKTWES